MSTASDLSSFTELTLTPPQWDFLQLDCKHPAFVAGFGTGKSQTLAVSATIDACEGGADALVAVLEPTFDLCRTIAVPRIQQILSELGIRAKYNKSDNMIYTSHGGVGDFIFRSMDNPSRLVGWESYSAHLDELDTLKKDNAKDVWLAMIGRTRQVVREVSVMDWLPTTRPLNRVAAYCTPEGFNFLYGRWAKDKERAKMAGYGMIQAASMSNPFLPKGYLDSLRASYDPQRFKAYAEGRFVNLNGGSIYHKFDRKLNGCDTKIIAGEPLTVGQDFNVGKMATVVYVDRWGDDGLQELHAVAEIKDGVDTPDVIEKIYERFPGHEINVYPDASGQNTSSKSASVSDVGLLEAAGFLVHVHGSNPRVKDRVISMNTMICNNEGRRRLRVNEKACPTYADCLEQQIYAKNGEPDKTGGKDHMNDAGGYPVAYRFPIIRDKMDTSNFSIRFAR